MKTESVKQIMKTINYALYSSTRNSHALS